MHFDQAALNNVVFLGYRKNGAIKWGGTGFVVFVPVTDDLGVPYLVTARHCVEKIVEVADDGRILIRVNTFDGQSQILDMTEGWTLHPDSGNYVDVAVRAISRVPGAEWAPLTPQFFLTAEIAKEKCVGIGDDVFIIGLFRMHPGDLRSIPIGRVGTIAAVPPEPIWTAQYGQMDAVLIECRSMGGLSGSPVFVTLDPFLDIPPNSVIVKSAGSGRGKPPYRLLGLVHGHWESDTSDDFRDSRLNMGIAIVVPAVKILEALFSPQAIANREALMALHTKS